MPEKGSRYPGLMSLKPSRGSEVDLRRRFPDSPGQHPAFTREALAVAQHIEEPITGEFPDHLLLTALRTAASIGDIRAFNRAYAKMYYWHEQFGEAFYAKHHTVIDMDEIEVLQNAAVVIRDQALQLRREGKFGDAREMLAQAQFYYEAYANKSDNQDYVNWTQIRAREKGARSGRELLDRIEGEESVSKRLPDAHAALEHLDDLLEKIRDGEVVYPQVDRRWEMVRFHDGPSKKEFPQAYKGYEWLREEVARRHAKRISEEGRQMTTEELLQEMDRYERMWLLEFFGPSVLH